MMTFLDALAKCICSSYPLFFSSCLSCENGYVFVVCLVIPHLDTVFPDEVSQNSIIYS